MVSIALILGIFVTLELFQLPAFRRDELTVERLQWDGQPESAAESFEGSYETGNRMIHLFCVAMIGSSYYCLGLVGMLFALIPILMVAAALDAFWIRVCLQRTSVSGTEPHLHRSRQDVRARRAAR